jgi:hypothetical protein
VINISNFTSKDNPRWLQAEPVRPASPGRPPGPPAAHVQAPGAGRAGTCSLGARTGNVFVVLAVFMLGWLAAIARRLGDRLFAMNDNEAYWRGWQITGVHGGLGRRYRDPLFDTLAECSQCHGAGVSKDVPCAPCLGAGRITIDGVS